MIDENELTPLGALKLVILACKRKAERDASAALKRAQDDAEWWRFRALLHIDRFYAEEAQREANAEVVGKVDLGELRKVVAGYEANVDTLRSKDAKRRALYARALLVCLTRGIRPMPLPEAGCACSVCAGLRQQQTERHALCAEPAEVAQ